jgi:hypothetical protein
VSAARIPRCYGTRVGVRVFRCLCDTIEEGETVNLAKKEKVRVQSLMFNSRIPKNELRELMAPAGIVFAAVRVLSLKGTKIIA